MTVETLPLPRVGLSTLDLEGLVAVARGRAVLEAHELDDAMADSAQWVDGLIDGMRRGESIPPVYSINTGFGSLAGRAAFEDPDDAAELSRRLILSNASGVGADAPLDTVRATMAIRAASLARGTSGVRAELVHCLLAMLERGVTPVVPEYGSLGASGDLIPLAHIALVMCDVDPDESGTADYDGRTLSGAEAMAAAGITRIRVQAKDGLALLNGTSFSCAQVALALADAENLLAHAQVAAAMSIEALLGFGDAFIAELHDARGQRGQIAVASRLRELLEGSALVDGGRDVDPVRQPPQDSYSLRCVPQVLGPVVDTLAFVRTIVENEITAATDNPLIFPQLSRSLKAVSGGNFHAEYLAIAADFLSIVVTEIGNIAERRLFRLDDGSLNRGLPDMLIRSEQVGLDCGYMLPQYLAAALVSDCKTLAHPDSVDSIPTCANQEDHVSMANNAGRHARQVVQNIRTVVGIEFLMAAQALDLRLEDQPDRRPSAAASAVVAALRASRSADGRSIDHLKRDGVLYPRVQAAGEIVADGRLLRAADEALGRAR
ncbi:HAL/PAL/TAL family ammonia-lyase [Microbacterium sp. RD1]|uniref:HAL/PAL/TAL family ammonia-lyase n=1 Tax=Microbacterium sp. RD1 TaxID=3457313 RepID=UPI003FA5366F